MSESSVAYLAPDEGELLLQIAYRALDESLRLGHEWRPDLDNLPARLREPGCSFVTLRTAGHLHGCIGTVASVRLLAIDVALNAVSAALNDPRFPPLAADELPDTAIEISVLGPMQSVPFHGVDDLIAKIQPGQDGVMMRKGWRRGLLLPQVWEQITSPQEFLAHVALKAGLPPTVYGERDTEVFLFRVQHFER